VRGDLDWIVMKCLEKDRSRRYETASGLAADVLRYLADEPVSAAAPSRLYRLHKFARKHKMALAAAAAFAVLLVAGTVVSAWQAVRATRAQHLADERLIEVKAANAAATKALEQSQEEQRLAEAVSDYLVEAFGKPDPEQDGRELKVVDLLDEAVLKLDSEFTGSPKIKGELFDTLGKTYIGLGLPTKAIPAFEKALRVLRTELGPDEPKTLASMNNLGLANLKAGRLDEAVPLLEETLKLTRAKLGPGHVDTLRSMNSLAQGYLHAGRLAKALLLHEETLKLAKANLGPDDPKTLTAMNNLATAYHEAGRLADALPLYEETLKLRKAKLGPDHPDTLTSLNNLASAYQDAGRLAEAVPMFEETLKLLRQKAGADHPNTLGSMNNLARAYQSQGNPARAEPLLRECLAIRQQKQPDDWTTFNTMSLLGGALLGQKKHAAAEPLLVTGYQGMKQRAAKIPQHGKVRLSEALDRLVRLYEATGKQDEAAKWRRELEAVQAASPVSPPAKQPPR
jgi:tetratricopeptide (TPR) repeat protein